LREKTAPSARKRPLFRALLFLLAAALLLAPFGPSLPPWAGESGWLWAAPPVAALLAALAAALVRRFSLRHPSPWFLPFHLGATFALGWMVKTLVPMWPLAPLAFIVLFPFSLVLRPPADLREVTFSRFWLRPDILWLPLLALLLPALGRGLFPPRLPDLLLWTGGFFLWGLLFALANGWWRYESWYRRQKDLHDRLWRDAGEITARISGGAPLTGGTRGARRRPMLAALTGEQDQLLQEILKMGIAFFSARTGVFFLFEGQGFAVRAMATEKGLGGKTRAALLPVDEGLIRDAVKRGTLLLEGDCRRPAADFPFYGKGVAVGSFILRVVESGDPAAPWFGAVYFDSAAPDYFGDDEVTAQQMDRIISAIRRIYGLTLIMKQQFDAVDRSEQQMDFAGSLTRTLDPGSIASQALQSLMQVLPPPGCQGWAVVLLDQGRAHVPAAEGILSGARDLDVDLDPSAQSVVGAVLRQAGDPLLPGPRKGRLPGGQCYFSPGERLGEVGSFTCHPSAMRREEGMEVLAVMAVAGRDEGGLHDGAAEWVKTVADMTAPALSNAFTHREVERLSRTDPLTGLDNRRTFVAALEKKIRRMERYPEEEPFALLLMDLDHFKKVNDTWGHPVGDEVLRETARRIRASLREFDTIGRYGGEEFIALLDQVKSEQDCEAIAEKLRLGIGRRPFSTRAGELAKTVSVGFALFRREEGVTLQELIDRADQALYQAKETGRDRVVGYDRGQRAPHTGG
jgi:diguanylate cyclase (GGDEF)-like protein